MADGPQQLPQVEAPDDGPAQQESQQVPGPADNDGDEPQRPQVIDDDEQNPVRQCRNCYAEETGVFKQTYEGFMARVMPRPIVEYKEYQYLGPLIKPCRCKGSNMYIHTECLRSWRETNANNEQFYQCGTCRYKYQIGRLTWGQIFKSWTIQLAFTIVVMIGIVFVMGWVADPILNFWFEPEDVLNMKSGYGYFKHRWLLHFFKGVSSLGVIGFIQTILSASPFTWWNLRAGGLAGGRNRRQRNSDSMVFVLVIGFIAFLIVGRYSTLQLVHLLMMIIRLYFNLLELGARELLMWWVIPFLITTRRTTNKTRLRTFVILHPNPLISGLYTSLQNNPLYSA